ncbi:hypothetical protein ASD37_01245 [Mycobacterium sp. Root135]|nr:hypothetical protein ASD37_01245 [Mycobacterium sp. Root135]
MSPVVRTTQPANTPHESHNATSADRLPTTYARCPRWTTSGTTHTQWWLQLNGDSAADAIPTTATPSTA